MEQKPKTKKQGRRLRTLFIVLGILALVVLGNNIYMRIFAYDTTVWEGSFVYSTTNWGYTTKSYVTVTINGEEVVDAKGKAQKFYKGTCGFTRSGSTANTVELKVDEYEMVQHLLSLGYDLKEGDRIKWTADAEVDFHYKDPKLNKTLVSLTRYNVADAYEENEKNRTFEREAKKATGWTIDDATFEDTGVVMNIRVLKEGDDETNVPNDRYHSYCHHFNDGGYWAALCNGKEFPIEAKHFDSVITIKYADTDGTVLDSETVKKKQSESFSVTAEETMTHDGSSYVFKSWEMTDAEGNGKSGTTRTISINNLQSETYTIRIIYEKTETYTIEYIIHYMKDDEEVGSEEESHEYAENTTYEGHDFGETRSYDGEAYVFSKSKFSGSVTGSGHVAKSGKVTGNGTVELWYNCEPDVTPPPTPTPTPTPEPHECTFVWGGYDATNHWYECKECGKKQTHAHQLVQTGEADENGNVIKTCDCEEHPECDYSESVHKHEWVSWHPDYEEQDGYDPDEDYEEQGYAYDPDVYHWKYCAYHSCTKVTGKEKHVKGPYEDEGEGYTRSRCTKCNWILDEIPITVSLSINPNGGTFPDGSTDIIVLDDALEYGSVTDLGKLGPEYWVTFEEGYAFTGFYVVEAGNSGCFYAPDAATQTCTAYSQYFRSNGNGTYTSRLTKNYVLHAQKGAMEYTVHYNANGGTGLMYDSHYKVGEAKALNPNGYQYVSKITYNNGGVSCTVETNQDNTNISATFTGWRPNDANGPAVYADKEVVKDLIKSAGTVNLYAIWDYGTIILPNAIASDGGNKLSGWKTADGEFLSVLDSSGNYTTKSYTLKGGNETFTAVWVPNEYTVSFDSDGGTGCDPITVVYQKAYGYNNAGLPTTTKTGYTFLHWKYKLTNKVITNESIVETPQNHELTAIWKVNDVTVYLDYNFNFEQTAKNPKKNSSLTSVNSTKDKMVLPYDSYYGKLPQPTMDGYTFAGWYFEEGSDGNGCGEQNCLLNETSSRVTNAKEHTLYARWVKEQYRIDLDYNYDYSIWEED